MTGVQQFAYGPVNPIFAVGCAFIGALLGLNCAARARLTRGARRARWLFYAAIAIGGPGIWLMHFVAMLGFDVPASTVRYSLVLTLLSLVAAVGVVTAGLFIAAYWPPSPGRTIVGGVFTGLGIAGMHYTGMAAVHTGGVIDYDPRTVAASVLLAVVASIVALWFAVALNATGSRVTASAIMAVAVAGMHYTGMAAVHVHLATATDAVPGLDPLALVLPIMALAIGTLMLLIFSSLGLVSDDDRAEVTVVAAGAPRASRSIPLSYRDPTLRSHR